MNLLSSQYAIRLLMDNSEFAETLAKELPKPWYVGFNGIYGPSATEGEATEVVARVAREFFGLPKPPNPHQYPTGYRQFILASIEFAKQHKIPQMQQHFEDELWIWDQPSPPGKLTPP